MLLLFLAQLTHQGAKIRGTYVKWALGEKKRLEDELEQKKGEVSAKEAQVEQARGECFLCGAHTLYNIRIK